MSTPLQWNDPSKTWPLASFTKPERRSEARPDRRKEPKRSAEGERRKPERRSLLALLRL